MTRSTDPPFGINDAILAAIGLTLALAVASLLTGCAAEPNGAFPYLCGEQICNPSDECVWVMLGPDGPGAASAHEPGAEQVCCDPNSETPNTETGNERVPCETR